jgi:hypothetical protein
MSSSASSSVATAATPEDVTPSPEAIAETYVATWNETDPARRRAGIAAAWAEAGTYRDPVMASDGHAGVDAMLAGVQARFPGFVLKRTSRVDAHNGPQGRSGGSYVRFGWSLGPASGPTVVEGVDFCTLAPDGRLASVVGFIDKAPG